MPTMTTAPMGAALRLAEMSGRGIGWQQAFERDIKLMALAQQRQAESNRQQAQERAFTLQTAALQTRTPTSRRQAVSPFAKAVGQRQVLQLEELNTQLRRGQVDPLTYSRNKLRILGGQAVQYPKAPEPAIGPQQTLQLQELDAQLQQGQIDPLTYSQNKLRILGGQGVQYPETFAPKSPTEAYLSAVTAGPRAQLEMLKKGRMRHEQFLMDPSISDEQAASRRKQLDVYDAEIERVARQLRTQAEALYDPLTGRGQPEQAPAQPEEDLPDPAGYSEGHILRNTADGTRVILQNGQWRQM